MILVINNHSHLLRALNSAIKKTGVPFVVKDQKDSLSKVNKKKIKGIILSGGTPDLDKEINIKQIRADLASLSDYSVPILGICEGHQIIAVDSGGEVSRLQKASINKGQRVKLLKRDKIFAGLPEYIEGFEYHGLSVTKKPKDFVLAASSTKTKNEAFFHKTKPIYSVQFHPERSGEYGKMILENFLKICHEFKN